MAEEEGNGHVRPVAAAAAAVVRDVEQIESLEQWLESNGLRAAEDQMEQDRERWEFTFDQQRVQEATAYQTAIHEKIFGHEQDDAQELEYQQKQQQLQAWQGKIQLDIMCQNGQVRLTNIDCIPLAASCQFVYALAASWNHFNDNEEQPEENYVDTNANLDADTKVKPQRLLLNLPEYTASTVHSLLDVVNHTIQVQDITDGDRLVELCQLAHYLRGEAIVDDIETIFVQSIDTHNCMTLTQLADQLNMKRLFEASLQRMMQSIQNLEHNEFWEDLTPELRQRITAIQSAIQTSIHDQRSALYFGSLTEYLAIFAERICYYKERLEEAEEQQSVRPKSAAWYDAQQKIDRQRTRLQTLQIAFQEQKQLFSSSSSSLSASSSTSTATMAATAAKSHVGGTQKS
jgi:hypothetical protein